MPVATLGGGLLENRSETHEVATMNKWIWVNQGRL